MQRDSQPYAPQQLKDLAQQPLNQMNILLDPEFSWRKSSLEYYTFGAFTVLYFLSSYE